MRGNGEQKRRIDPRRNTREFLGCRSRRRKIARREHDLDIGGKHTWPNVVWRFVQYVTDRGRRQVNLALRQAQLRQTRLRLAAELARLPVRVFCKAKVTAQAMQLALLVQRFARGGMRRRVVESLARALRLVHRI